VYLAEVDDCAIYCGLFGNDYGFENAAGVSPTEQEFDRASAAGKTRLIFVKGTDDKARHPKMRALIRKAGGQLIRRRFGNTSELTAALYASLVGFLDARGTIQSRPFEDRPAPGATLDDIDAGAVAAFVRRARAERQVPLPADAPLTTVLTHLNLLCDQQPTQAALLLFGRQPQRFTPAAEVRCMHFHGTEIQRPAPYYQIFQGSLFEQVDRATNFALGVLNRGVGTRALSAQAPVIFEIPPTSSVKPSSTPLRTAITLREQPCRSLFFQTGLRFGIPACCPRRSLRKGSATRIAPSRTILGLPRRSSSPATSRNSAPAPS